MLPTLDPTHVAAIRSLGYGEREAEFLALVGSLGGYFVRRQFSEATGYAKGRADVAFTRQLIGRRHASVHVFCRSTEVYHLTARRLYGVDADVPVSARRRRSSIVVKSRLMAIDVALARPAIRFLVRESEGVAYCDRLGVDRGRLPQHVYYPYRAATSVTRYFSDGGLVGVDPSDGAGVPTLVLVYIDDGAGTLAGFVTYLKRYAALLAVLPSWRIIYACSSAHDAALGARAFDRAFGRVEAATAEKVAEDLRDYFRLRQLRTAERWSELSTASLERLADYRARFGGAVDPLYERWLVAGDAAIDESEGSKRAAERGSSPRFEPLILEHSYAAVEPVRGVR